MPWNRYRLPGPEGPAATKLEIIMSPFSLPGCAQADDLAVTVRGGFRVAPAVGPLVTSAGTTGGWQVTAPVITAAAVARGTQAVHRRVQVG